MINENRRNQYLINMSSCTAKNFVIYKYFNEYSHLHYIQLIDLENRKPILKCNNSSMAELNCEPMIESHSTAKN